MWPFKCGYNRVCVRKKVRILTRGNIETNRIQLQSGPVLLVKDE